jgi:(R,R)-butanediol dehydrogenase/meso-butanediol dehydrogenase/diacetyl reductase
MLALTWSGVGAVAVAEMPEPVAAPGWAVVDVAYAGICGTDLHIWRGLHPRARTGVVLGHEIVGWLTAESDGIAAGTPVFVNPSLCCGTCIPCRTGLSHVCDRLGLVGIDVPGGLATRVAAPVEGLVPLPGDLDMHTAALIEPTAVAVRALRRSGVTAEDTVHVVGAGPIGLLVGLLARAAGCSAITFSEPVARRADGARRLGFDVPASPAPADVVFDCTGNPAGSPGITRSVATAGALVIVGIYPGTTAFDLQDVAFREINVVGTRTYERSDIDAAVEALAAGRIVPDVLITSTLPLADAAAAIERLHSGLELKVIVDSRNGGTR